MSFLSKISTVPSNSSGSWNSYLAVLFFPPKKFLVKNSISSRINEMNLVAMLLVSFKNGDGELGESRTMALRRFLLLERRLEQNPELKHEY